MAFYDPDTTESPAPPAGGAAAFDLWGYARACLRFWWLIVLCLLLCLGAGVAFTAFSTPVYVASAEIKVERRAGTSAVSLSGAPMGMEGATTVEDLKTIEKSFISPMLMRRIVESIREGDFATLRLGGYSTRDMGDDKVAAFLMNDTTVALIPDTRLIQISVRNEDPFMAQRLANLVMEEGIEYDRDQRLAAVGSNIRYLREEVKKLEDNLRASEEKLNAYTRTLGNVSIDGDLNIVANQLRELNTRSTAAKAERLRIESDYSQIQSYLNDPVRLMTIESIRRMPSVVALQSQIAEAKGKVARLAQRYRDSNPFMVQARTELAQLEDALQREILAAPRSVEAALSAARRNEEKILKEQNTQEEKVIQVRDLSVPSRVLQRQIDADRMAYEAALKRLSEELSQARSQPVMLQIVNPAGPGLPSGSRPAKVYAMSVMGGLLLGFGLVFLITQLDASIKSAEEAESVLGLGVLASIPTHQPPKLPATGEKAAGLWEDCPAVTDTYSPTAEALRSMRTSLRAFERDGVPRTVLVTSPHAREGKSFTAANLAIVLAQSGQRTLLVDAHLRQPSIERMVFDSYGHPGLSDFLGEKAGLAQVIHSSSLPNLDVVTAGAPCPVPAEALSRRQLADFLEAAQPLYDNIIVDSAPVATVSDTLSMAHLFPVIVVVLRSGRTLRGAARRTIELLRRAGGHPSGLVFNFAPHQFLSGENGATAGPPPAVLHPASCPDCGRSFPTLGEFLRQTTGAEPGEAGAPGSVSISRRCPCGHVFTPGHAEQTDLRDHSAAGLERRRIFGELLAMMSDSGLDAVELRRNLVLVLKLWRNEMSGEAAKDSSAAAQRRQQMFEDLAQRLVASGLTPVQARQRILEAARTWREAP